MRGFISLPVIVLGFSLTMIAALLDYIGGLLMQLGCSAAGNSAKNDFWMNKPHPDDRHFNS